MTLDAGTLALVLLAVAAVGTVASSLASALAPTHPGIAAACRVVAAVLIDLRAALLAGQAPPAAVAAPKPPVPPLVVLALALLAGCTPAARQTAATIIGDVASATPVICALVSAGNPSAGSACSVDAGAASDVAKLIAGILAGLPASMGAAVPGNAGVSLVYKGIPVTVVLPASQASAVAAKLAGK